MLIATTSLLGAVSSALALGHLLVTVLVVLWPLLLIPHFSAGLLTSLKVGPLILLPCPWQFLCNWQSSSHSTGDTLPTFDVTGDQ